MTLEDVFGKVKEYKEDAIARIQEVVRIPSISAEDWRK